MKTQFIKIKSDDIDFKKIQEAGNILKTGGLVAFPTETVYGLGGNALDKHASAKIYEAKGRPGDNPLIIHIADMESLDKIVENVSEEALRLASNFWPGPLTIILEKKPVVPETITGGLNTVAVRMPSHPIALELIRAGGGFIAAPSANTSGRPSPTTAEHVKEDLNGKIEAIIDGGPVDIGLESTIVDLSTDNPVILRPGYIGEEELSRILGQVKIDQALLKEKPDQAPKAPGMKYKHYAPKADLTIVEGNPDSVVESINKMMEMGKNKGIKYGILCTSETLHAYNSGLKKCIGNRTDERAIAHNLYNILREFDEEDIDIIYSEAFYTPQMGQAIMNRLLKAAGYKIIQTKE